MILIITVFVSLFPWIYTLTRGGPGYSTTTLDLDVYQNALVFGFFGTAAAETVYLLIMIVLLAIVGGNALRFRRRGRR
jgi:ABC-type sugar transport system permease subunit